MPVHICPNCGTTHSVHPVLDALSWGRQFTCCVDCEAARRHDALARNLDILHRERGRAERELMERHRHMEEND